jgi:hypothetical protein
VAVTRRVTVGGTVLVLVGSVGVTEGVAVAGPSVAVLVEDGARLAVAGVMGVDEAI